MNNNNMERARRLEEAPAQAAHPLAIVKRVTMLRERVSIISERANDILNPVIRCDRSPRPNYEPATITDPNDDNCPLFNALNSELDNIDYSLLELESTLDNIML